MTLKKSYKSTDESKKLATEVAEMLIRKGYNTKSEVTLEYFISKRALRISCNTDTLATKISYFLVGEPFNIFTKEFIDSLASILYRTFDISLSTSNLTNVSKIILRAKTH